MKDIILAGKNQNSKAYKQIGECLENAPDLNHSGKPIIHLIGNKADLDKALSENVIDTVIFVAEQIPKAEGTAQPIIPIDVELLDELVSAHQNTEFIVIVPEMLRSSQKLLRLYMHEHYNIIYREELAASVSGLVKLIRSEKSKDEAFQYCSLEGVPLEPDNRTDIYSPTDMTEEDEEDELAMEMSEDVKDEPVIEDVGIDFDDMGEDEEPIIVEKPSKAKNVEETVEDEEEIVIPSRRKVEPTPKKKVEVKSEAKAETKAEKKAPQKTPQKAENKQLEQKKKEVIQPKEETLVIPEYNLTLPATALEMVRLEIVSADTNELILKIPEGHTLKLPTNLKDTPTICVLLNKR